MGLRDRLRGIVGRRPEPVAAPTKGVTQLQARASTRAATRGNCETRQLDVYK